MAGVFYKLLRKPSALRTITSFNNTQSSNLSVTHLLHANLLSEIKPNDPCNLNPLLGSLNKDQFNLSQPLLFYPSFPFAYCLNPISSTGSNPLEELTDVVESGDDARTVWADSVKKKRKKKMNKHKYKKLRKRLRRKA